MAAARLWTGTDNLISHQHIALSCQSATWWQDAVSTPMAMYIYLYIHVYRRWRWASNMCAAASFDCDVMLYETAGAVVQHQPLPKTKKQKTSLSIHPRSEWWGPSGGKISVFSVITSPERRPHQCWCVFVALAQLYNSPSLCHFCHLLLDVDVGY